jgi:hypothetical protein
MIKHLFLVGLATATLGAATVPALAQVDIKGTVTTIQTNAAHPTGANQGLFSVEAKQTSNPSVYDIFVNYLSTFAGNVQPPTNAYVDEIQVTLFGTGGITGAAGSVGAVNYSAFPVGAGAFFLDPGANPAGDVTLGQSFVGSVSVSPSFVATGASFILTTQNGANGSGSGNFSPSVTPEGASLLLLLPGLIPVAVGLRRRRQNKPLGE